MARSFNADTDKLYSATTSAFPTNGTVFIRAKTTWAYNDGATHFFWAQESADVNVLHFQKNANDSLYVGHVGTGDTRLTLVGTGLFTSGVWRNYLYEYESTFQAFYVDNVLVISNTSNVNSTPAVGLTIGNTGPLNGGSFGFANFAGSLAEFAQWNRRLTSDEKYLLQVTGNPANIPSGRVKYYPLQGSVEPEPDTDSSEYLTVTSAPQDTHPATSLITTTTRPVAGARNAASLVVTNLCTNGGFESNLTGWNVVGVDPSSVRSNDFAYGGGFSLKISPAGSTGGRQITVSGLVSGELYTLSGRVYLSAFTSGQVNYDVNAAGLDTTKLIITSGTSASYLGHWTYWSETFKVPIGVTSVLIRFFGDTTPNFTAYIDNVQLEKGENASPYINTDGSTASNDIGRYAVV